MTRLSAEATTSLRLGGPFRDDGAKHIAVIGVDRPEFADTLARPIFDVDHTPGKLFISGIVISSGEGMAGASCSGGTLMWIDDTSIRNVIRIGTNQARGVVMNSCDTVRVPRTSLAPTSHDLRRRP